MSDFPLRDRKLLLRILAGIGQELRLGRHQLAATIHQAALNRIGASFEGALETAEQASSATVQALEESGEEDPFSLPEDILNREPALPPAQVGVPEDILTEAQSALSLIVQVFDSERSKIGVLDVMPQEAYRRASALLNKIYALTGHRA